MNKIFIYIMAIVFSVSITSCQFQKDSELEGHPDTSDDWASNISLSVNNVSEGLAVGVDLKSSSETVTSDMSQLEITINSNNIDEIANVDMYIFMAEKDGLNSKEPFSEPAKYKSFTSADIDEEGKITFDLHAQDLIALFSNDLTKDRTNQVLYYGDKFEIDWVVTGTDDKVYDTRSASGIYTSTFIPIEEEVLLSPWGGTFDWEWTSLTDDASYYGKVNVGDAGSVNIIPKSYDADSNIGTYEILDKFSFEYSYGSNSGTLTYDFNTEKTTVTGNSDEIWNITRVDDNTLSIDWEYYYSVPYNEYGTVKLTRTDNEVWPANIN